MVTGSVSLEEGIREAWGSRIQKEGGGASSWTQGIASANREVCKRNSSGIRIAEAEYAANGGSDIRFVL